MRGGPLGYKSPMRTNWLAILCVCLVGPATAAIEQADVTGGKVRGTVDNGVAAFKGIPFAAPPVGDLRWQAPRAVIPWSGVKQTTASDAKRDPFAFVRMTHGRTSVRLLLDPFSS